MISSACGPFEVALVNKPYRGLKLQSDATAVDLTVTSNGVKGISLHLEPGELVPGVMIIQAGAAAGLMGYLTV